MQKFTPCSEDIEYGETKRHRGQLTLQICSRGAMTDAVIDIMKIDMSDGEDAAGDESMRRWMMGIKILCNAQVCLGYNMGISCVRKCGVEG
jgi:hypothetical protein